jgi:uncharacterized protein YkwD
VTGVNPRFPSWRLLSAVLLLACARAAGPSRAPAPEFAGLERDVARRVNAYRTGRQLPALSYDTAVAAIARAHSRDMAAHRVPMGHDGFKQRLDLVDRFLPLEAFAENVALNDYSAQSTVRVAVAGWLASAHHLENIEGKYHVTGVGIVRARDGTFYYTQLFVARRASAGRR